MFFSGITALPVFLFGIKALRALCQKVNGGSGVYATIPEKQRLLPKKSRPGNSKKIFVGPLQGNFFQNRVLMLKLQNEIHSYKKHNISCLSFLSKNFKKNSQKCATIRNEFTKQMSKFGKENTIKNYFEIL